MRFTHNDTHARVCMPSIVAPMPRELHQCVCMLVLLYGYPTLYSRSLLPYFFFFFSYCLLYSTPSLMCVCVCGCVCVCMCIFAPVHTYALHLFLAQRSPAATGERPVHVHLLFSHTRATAALRHLQNILPHMHGAVGGMPPKQAQEKRKNAKKKSQRVRVTNKALESRQFSTVRLPRTSEVPAQKVDVHSMYQELACASSGGTPAASASKSTGAVSSASLAHSSSGFDPIANDAMFAIVTNSTYWPPPSLEELHAKTGHDHGDGFDSYDRREDDKKARKERVKVMKGEVNHPRGKPRQNTIIQLSDSTSSDDDDGEHRGSDAA
ncbi:hypothetical protein, conserved [Leishmania tarentolae]|uniref:Uncharacterized protein n=1 Tax=Leishmania tarentolae TaxID=5689 RepID=A0A640KCG8_LEITA|nr:hypothetical protein, conserved [Leishmania tarentolae]